MQYIPKFINLLSTLLHQLSNYICIKASSAIYWVLGTNVDIFLDGESKDWLKPNFPKPKQEEIFFL